MVKPVIYGKFAGDTIACRILCNESLREFKVLWWFLFGDGNTLPSWDGERQNENLRMMVVGQSPGDYINYLYIFNETRLECL